MQLQGKTAVVTGGGQGIGKGIARRFLEEGARVILAEQDADAGEMAVRELATLGEVHFVGADVGEAADIDNLAAESRQLFGGLDILVNNAGIMIRKPFTELSPEEWNRVLAVNLTGAFLCARALAPELRRSGGAIVNIASTRALHVGAGYRGVCREQGGTGRPHPCPGGQPRPRSAGELHQPGLDRRLRLA